MDFANLKKKAGVFFKDKHHVLALGIFLFALIIRMNYAFISGMWVDEGRYAVIGRALLDHPFEFSSRMHGLVTIFPPAFPYILFISQAILGAGDFAVRIINPILGSLSVLLIYAIGRMMFNKNVGLVAAALMSVSPIIWFYDDRVLTEAPMIFFSLLTIFSFYYGYERKNDKVLYASGVFFVLAYLSKQSGGFVLPAILLYLIASRRFGWVKEKRIWITALIALLAVLPWTIRSFGVCGSFSCEGTFALSWFKSAGGGFDVVYDYMYYVKLTPYLLTTAVLLLFFFGLIPLINGKKRNENLLLLTVAGVTYLFFAINPVKDLRYVILAAPMFLLLAAEGIDEIARQLSGKDIKYAPLIMAVILIPVAYGEYASGKELILQKAPGFLMLKDAGEYLEKTSSDTVIMAAPSQPISFYAGDKNMSGYPEKEEELARTILDTNTSYLIVDAYERTQRPWIWSYVPARPYLTLEKVFYQDGQPVVGIFKVDKEKLIAEIHNPVNNTGV